MAEIHESHRTILDTSHLNHFQQVAVRIGPISVLGWAGGSSLVAELANSGVNSCRMLQYRLFLSD